VNEHLSTQQVAWILDRSPGTVRDMIKDGEIEASRIAGGFRIPRDEAMRLARERIATEDGRKVTDRALETLIDELIATNEERLAAAH
jgi:excisionase family DNA binding protein